MNHLRQMVLFFIMLLFSYSLYQIEPYQGVFVANGILLVVLALFAKDSF